MCLWKERRYSNAENTFADNSRALCFPKDGCAHSNQDCVCVCWLYKWLNLFPTGFFFFSFSVSRKATVDFLTLPCADSQAETPVIRAIKILKASRIPYLTLWWDFMALMRHRSYSGQEVFPWQLSTPLMIHVSKMFFFFFLRARTKFVISPLLISTA